MRGPSIVMSLVLAVVLARMGLAQPAGAGGSGGGDAALDAMEKRAVEDAQKLAKELLPDRAQLGADWKLAWELPPAVAGKVDSEDTYWKQAGGNLGPSGMSDADAAALIDGFMQRFGAMAAQQGMTQRDGYMLMASRIRGNNLPSAVKVLEQWVGSARAMAMAANQTDAQRKAPPGQRQMAAQKAMIELANAPFAGLDDQQVRDVFVKQSSLMKRRTEMSYYRSNGWEQVSKARSDKEIADAGLWVGVVKVTIMIADEGRCAELTDLAPADKDAYQAKLADAVRATGENSIRYRQGEFDRKVEYAKTNPLSSAGLGDEQKRIAAEKAAFANMKANVEMPKFGDNAYIIRITGVSPDASGLKVGLYNAWIRQGNAMAEISLGGNFPEKEMDVEIARFMREIDAKISSYESAPASKIDLGKVVPLNVAVSAAGAQPAVKPQDPVTPPPKNDASVADAKPQITAPPTGGNDTAKSDTSGLQLRVDGDLPAGLKPIDPAAITQQLRQRDEKPQPQDDKPQPPKVEQPATPPPPPSRETVAQLQQAAQTYSRGDFAGAAKAYDRILQAEPRNAQAMTMRGASKYFLNDLPGALADYDAAAALNPADPASKRYATFVALCLGQADRAKRDADALLAANPNDIDATLSRAQAAMMLGEDADASKFFNRVSAADPKRATTIYTEAGYALSRKMYPVASIQFTTVLRLDPNLYQAWYGRAQAEAGLGHKQQAIASYESYLRYDKQSNFARQAQYEIQQLRR